VPYSEDEIISSPKELEGKTAEDALVAYLQGLGTNRKAIQLEERINTFNPTINEGK
jgi:cytochrome c oxidase cbb3-type subunit 2